MPEVSIQYRWYQVNTTVSKCQKDVYEEAYGRTSQAPQRDDVRSAIEKAASKNSSVLANAAITWKPSARRSGYTKGAVYSNYGSKQELFVSLAGSVLEPF
jgi:hypothetical protein